MKNQYKLFDTLYNVVACSRQIFSLVYIEKCVGYSRQTISAIHHNKATVNQARKYLSVMIPKLKALGFQDHLIYCGCDFDDCFINKESE